MKQPIRFIILLFVILSAVVACTTPPAPPPTVANTQTPLSTPKPADTATSPAPTATIFTEPTATERPTKSPTLEPTTVPETPTAQPPTLVPTAIPATVPTGVIELEGATLPAGFSLRKVIEIDRPIGLMFDPDGDLYVSNQSGELRIYRPQIGNPGEIEYANVVSGFRFLHGMAFHPETNDLYISTAGKLSILRDTDGDGLEDQVIPLVDNIPFGLHQNNVPKFGPDGMLYLGVGSTCDACDEVDPRSGTVMRFDPVTGDGEVVASGLRNPFDIAFHPETGDLFATDNGRDDLGDDDPAEELNHIVLGNDYGWPGCWGELVGECAGTTQAVGFFAAHSSVNNLLFYTGDSFPAEYENELFALNFGSFLVQAKTGLQRVSLSADGDGSYDAEPEWFLQMPQGSFPLGLALSPNGDIYFGDYINGGVWRVSYGR